MNETREVEGLMNFISLYGLVQYSSLFKCGLEDVFEL